MKYIDYFFYKFYSTILFKSWVENDTSYINTYLGIAGMLCFNIMSVMFLTGAELNVRIILTILFSLIIITYFTFIFKKRYLKIIERYKNNDPYPILCLTLMIIYIVFTFATFIFSAWWVRQGNL